MKKQFLLFILLSCFGLLKSEIISAQPKPGDLFREYHWKIPEEGEKQVFLRVGGRMGYRVKPENCPNIKFEGDRIPLDFDFLLEGATKAEVSVQKMLCHEGTKNLRISVNNNEEIVFPPAPGIPEPQELYIHHYAPTVELPVAQLHTGNGNFFSLQVDSVHPWNWPQNLIYDVIFRIYYEPDVYADKFDIEAIQQNEENVKINLTNLSSQKIKTVDYLAKYDGPDMDGDGMYYDWHYYFLRGNIRNHVGSSFDPPYQTIWDISWIPDQNKPVWVSARVNFKSGLTYFATPIQIELKRETYSVELCKPENQEQKWLTRNGENKESIFINSDINENTEAKMVFTTWSPGYFNGIYINDFLVFDREGLRYAFMQHDIPIKYLNALNSEENIVKTGKTPKHHGAMVHGVEVMWPGIMLLVKSKK